LLNTVTLGSLVLVLALIWLILGQLAIRWRKQRQLKREILAAEKRLKERKKFLKRNMTVEKWSKELELATEDHTCSICMEDYKLGDKVSSPSSLTDSNSKSEKSCKHIFHSECIEIWLYNKAECPICRIRFFGDDEKSATFLAQNEGNEIDEENNEQVQLNADDQQEQVQLIEDDQQGEYALSDQGEKGSSELCHQLSNKSSIPSIAGERKTNKSSRGVRATKDKKCRYDLINQVSDDDGNLSV